jgi:hypothetical protein
VEKARTTGAAERNESLRAIKRLGERLASRDPARQTAEVQIRCTILNTFNALGMPDTIVRT